MNELARMLDELDDCVVCGQVCAPDEYNDDDEPVHGGDCEERLYETRYNEYCGLMSNREE